MKKLWLALCGIGLMVLAGCEERQETGVGIASLLENPPLSVESTAGAASTESAKTEAPQADRAMLMVDASLHGQPALGNVDMSLCAGSKMEFSSTDSILWYEVKLDDGTRGYICGEFLCRIDKNGGTEGRSLLEASLQERFASLQKQLPEGMYWNHMGIEGIGWGEETPRQVTDIPCDHALYGEAYCNFFSGKTQELFPQAAMDECLGFAALLSDEAFGPDAPIHEYFDPSLLRVGDHIRLRSGAHSMTVIEMDAAGVTVAEVNADFVSCAISWSRVLSWEELYGLAWDSRCLSRYPLCPDGDGGFSAWEASESETGSSNQNTVPAPN